MAKDFQQTDTVAPLGSDSGCTLFNLANTHVPRLASDGGTAGVGTPQFRFTNPQSSDEIGVMFELDPGEDMPSGDHTIRLRVTTTNTDITWTECHACYYDVNGGGLQWQNLGQNTGLGIVLDTAQVESTTIVGANAPANAYESGDRMWYVLVFNSAGAHGNNSGNFTPDQLITTPIEVVAGGIPIIMHHRRQMAVN